MSNRAMRALGVDLNVFITWYSFDLDANWATISGKPLGVEYRPDLLCADGW